MSLFVCFLTHLAYLKCNVHWPGQKKLNKDKYVFRVTDIMANKSYVDTVTFSNF